MTKVSLIEDLRASVDRLNMLWGALTRLEADFAASQMSQSGRLYRAYAVERDIVAYSPVKNTTTYAIGIGTVLLVFSVSWALLGLSWLARRGNSVLAKAGERSEAVLNEASAT